MGSAEELEVGGFSRPRASPVPYPGGGGEKPLVLVAAPPVHFGQTTADLGSQPGLLKRQLHQVIFELPVLQPIQVLYSKLVHDRTQRTHQNPVSLYAHNLSARCDTTTLGQEGVVPSLTPMSDDYPQVTVESRADLRRWLARNHQTSRGIWLVSYKKNAGERYLPYDDIVEEALCFGWVDSRPRKVDELRSALLLTPRKPKSRWSRPNKERVAQLTRQGLMAPAGIAVVEEAKATGTWTALDEVENLIEPADLAVALDADVTARATWDDFPRSAKRGILEWILSAKKPETRQKRIAETVSEAAQGRRANQWPRR